MLYRIFRFRSFDYRIQLTASWLHSSIPIFLLKPSLETSMLLREVLLDWLGTDKRVLEGQFSPVRRFMGFKKVLGILLPLTSTVRAHFHHLCWGHRLSVFTLIDDITVCVCVYLHRKTTLLFFNRREEDILWRGELEQLAADNKRCYY